MKSKVARHSCKSIFLMLTLLLTGTDCLGVSWDWSKWWTYEGISGPQFWGLINPHWSLCTNGRRQSPVDINPATLLFDPNLRPLTIDKEKVSGIVNNTGHSVVFAVHSDHDKSTLESRRVSGKSSAQSSVRLLRNSETNSYHSNSRHSINITGGALSYKYKVYEVQLHFGSNDLTGSEHLLNGSGFPAEVQIYAYNTNLFKNHTEALSRPHGITVISVMVQLSHTKANRNLLLLTEAVSKMRYLGYWTTVTNISVEGLLPQTEQYFTYGGSLTQPPCYETVTWHIMNKPIYMGHKQLHGLRNLYQGTTKRPRAKMAGNTRPTQFINNRTIRTNIDFTETEILKCPSLNNGKKIYKTAHHSSEIVHQVT